MITEFSCFTGYGGSTWAMRKIGIPHKVVGWSEIEPQSIRCFQQNFPEYKDLNYGDISKIDKNTLLEFNLLTGGFPCQDVSIAGNRDLEKGRTNLYKEMVEIAKLKKPKYILMENVVGLLSMKSQGRLLIDIIVKDFKVIGYGVAWKVLNSCDYGVPQSRRRIWIACKLGGWEFGEPNLNFQKKNGLVITDILEPEVNEKYYLSEKQVKRLLESADLNNQFSTLDADIAGTQTRRQYANWRGNFVSDRILQLNNPVHSSNRIYSENGLSPTITSCNADKNNYNIRKLTPRECFRLQGFMDDEINLDGFSDSAKYRMAGNGWEINVASLVLNSMLKGDDER